jgi:hypothetical protein
VRVNRLCAQGRGYVKTRRNTQACLHQVRVVGSQGSFLSRGTVVRIAKKEISDEPILIIGGPVPVRNMQEDQL